MSSSGEYKEYVIEKTAIEWNLENDVAWPYGLVPVVGSKQTARERQLLTWNAQKDENP